MSLYQDIDNRRNALEILKKLEANLDKIPESMIGFAIQEDKGSLSLSLLIAIQCLEEKIRAATEPK